MSSGAGATGAGGEGTGPRSLRFTIEYRGTDMSIVDRRSLDMPAPISDAIRGYDGQSGFWYELRSPSGETLYRRVLHNPLRFHVEEHALEPSPTMRRRAVEQPSGVFTVLVPDDPQAATLVVFSSPPDPAALAEPAGRIAEFSLRQSGGQG
jgi:hypothetical protein